jgi:hypothetical protein
VGRLFPRVDAPASRCVRLDIALGIVFVATFVVARIPMATTGTATHEACNLIQDTHEVGWDGMEWTLLQKQSIVIT